MKLGMVFIVHNGEELLEYALKAVRSQADYIDIVFQTKSHSGQECGPDLLPTIARLKGLWDSITQFIRSPSASHKENETAMRNLGHARCIDHKCTHHVSCDVDEFYLPEQLAFAKKMIEENGHDTSVVMLENYYKHPTYKIIPNQGHHVSFIQSIDIGFDKDADFPLSIDLSRKPARHTNCRMFEPDDIVCHHMSYVRKSIKRKIANSSMAKMFADQDKFVSEFDKYQVGERLRVAPDFISRRTELVENTFGIEI